MKIYIFVDNSMTGHKMPSGSADLRQLWLELEAHNGDEIIPIPALSEGADTYDVTGKGPFDQEILGEELSALSFKETEKSVRIEHSNINSKRAR